MDRIVLTGATGYIGSNLVRKLLDEEKKVFIIIRDKSKLDLIADIISKVTVYTYNGDISRLIRFFKEIKPNVVYHLASLFIAEHDCKDVNNLIDSNVKFGVEVLEAMNQAGVKNLINTGTSWQHYNNEDYNPVCLYAATKEAFEKIIEYYTKACGFRVITLKLFDTYGPKDNRKKILNLLDKYSKEKTLLKMSEGDQLLDLTYIDDVIFGFFSALNNLSDMEFYSHEKYSISGGKRYKLRDVVNLYESITGNKVLVEWGVRPYRKREVMNPCTCIKELPNWKVTVSFEDGLRLMNHINSLIRQGGGKKDE